MENQIEFNFIKSPYESDKELFFGPLNPNDPNDSFVNIQDGWTMANIVVNIGIFSSLTQARKNGFGGEIQKGFSDFYVGKLKRRVTILNVEK